MSTVTGKIERRVMQALPHFPAPRAVVVWRYTLALLLTVAAVAIRHALGGADLGLPFLTFFPAFTLAAIFGGFGPGLLSMILGAVIATVLFIPPYGEFSGTLQASTLWANVVFITDGLLVISAIRAMHKHIDAHRNTSELLAEKENLLKSVIQGTTDAIYAKDTAGRYLLFNDAAARFAGRPASEMIGQDDSLLFSPEVVQQMRENQRSIMTERKVITRESPVVFQDGRSGTFQTTMGPLIDQEGSVKGVFGISRDITEVKRAEEQLRLAARIFDRAAEGVVVTDARNRILTVNSAFTEVTGYSIDEVIGQSPSVLKSGRQSDEFYHGMWDSLSRQGWWQGEIWNRRKNGDIYLEWLSINVVRDQAGQILNYVGLMSDISLVRNSQQRIAYLATHDELTSLPNRTLVLDRLNLALARAARGQTQIAVLFVDLDNFKFINDSLGHEQGDALLVQVAMRLRESLRTQDTVARLGGDEFIVLLESTHDQETRMVAERILAAVSGNYSLAGKDIFISASIGISCFPVDGEKANELMKCADTAMYRAKEQGKNSYRFFTAEMADVATERIEIETGLREAIAKQELFLEYQPQVSLSDGSLIGAEALIRWRRDGTVISPISFIPVAEESTIIIDLEEWVTEEVCRQMQAWDEAGIPPFRVSVNISGRHFRSPGMAQHLRQIVAASMIDPQRICIEITESVLANVEHAMDALRELQLDGFVTSIDDFGTGFSSLSYLKRFPIRELKIDRSFVQGIATDSDDRAITLAIIAMAHSMGLHVIAEGVEDLAQRDQLRDFGCESAQGFLFARPMSATAFQKWMTEPSGAAVKQDARGL